MKSADSIHVPFIDFTTTRSTGVVPCLVVFVLLMFVEPRLILSALFGFLQFLPSLLKNEIVYLVSVIDYAPMF